jgi:hypothetical protein
MSLLNYLKKHEQHKKGEVRPPLPPLARKQINLLGTLNIIIPKSSDCVLLYVGLLFEGFYAITALIPANFLRVYPFNSVQIGLCYSRRPEGKQTSLFGYSGRLNVLDLAITISVFLQLFSVLGA